MFSTNIRSHVIKAVDTMINEVQKNFDAEVAQIDRDAASAKMVAREKAVESIVNKFR